ncbi:hypothetical protein HYC85_020442 [Camellia sinensis]|uniref:F-box protein n=1 Tax=Camellia sinensis TaxID=4442 RepID=A0A7J7GQ17_CAMSI|nr:hypothetical protein HYC85_020442 [Camellia sinensis]
MANLTPNKEPNSFSFSDFPEDVQLCILSFLSPSELSSFASTSKPFVSLCRNDAKLWFALCDRRWGSKTQIRKWGNGKITYKQLYKALNEFENLIGFWRRSGHRKIAGLNSPPPPLAFFEWGSSFITGSRVSPSKSATYGVVKAPFLWISIMPNGAPVSFLDPECRFELFDDLVKSGELGLLENELVPVNVSFMGKNHVVVEENLSFAYSNSLEGRQIGISSVSSSGNLRGDENGVVEDVIGAKSGSPGSLLMSEIYQYFANRTSPGGDRASRKQRKREKGRQGRKKLEPEHFVKIDNCSPTPSRPLQGLWKVLIPGGQECSYSLQAVPTECENPESAISARAPNIPLERLQQNTRVGICDDMNLDFYLVTYDDIGGIACRRVGDSSQPFSDYSPVFWTSNTTFIQSPFCPEEEYIYDSRMHLRPLASADPVHGQSSWMENEVVSRILDINSSYDLVIPNLAGASANPQQVEGRIWQYRDGTFGFGFLRNNYIIDLKHIAQNGCILDIMELCSD